MKKFRVIDLSEKTLIHSTDNIRYANEWAKSNCSRTGNVTVVCGDNYVHERIVSKKRIKK